MPELSDILKNASEDVRRLWAEKEGLDLVQYDQVDGREETEAKRSYLEQKFLSLWEEGDFASDSLTPEEEYKFHPARKWRFDFAWPKEKVAVEIEGGVWSKGRHTRGQGFIDDCEKYNTATSMGWRVFRLPAEHFTEYWVGVIGEML